MDGNKLASTLTIKDSVDYLESEFLKPLKDTGGELMGIVEAIKTKDLKNVQIAETLDAINSKIEDYNKKLETIINKSREQLDTSSETIAKNQAEIEANLNELVQ